MMRDSDELGAIRRTDALFDLLAYRRLRAAMTIGDVAVSLLRSLAADVDRPVISPAAGGAGRMAAAGLHARQPRQQHTAGARGWVTAAAALLAMSFAAVSAVWLAAAAMLVRHGAAGGTAGRHAKPGRGAAH